MKDKSDAVNTGQRTSKTTGTADFGMYYYTRTFYWGLGLTHLNRGKITDNPADVQQAVHFFMTLGMSFLKGSTIINPSILFDELEIKRQNISKGKLPEYPPPPLVSEK